MKTKVAVLYGGRSGEHEISIRSAQSIIAALDREKYEVVEYFITKEGKWDGGRMILPEPGGNPGVDVVFPVLHGTFGEDGTMQGLLELADLSYVGPGVLASSLAMDKEVFKRVMRQSGLPVVESVTLDRTALTTDIPLPYPMFVKPANLGSSVGIAKVKNVDELRAALDDAARYDRKIVVERGITGREFECSVLGNLQDVQASTPCEILPSREFYDYEDKYLLDKAVIELPAKLDAEKTAEMQRLAVECYKACGCEGMSRVDFLLETATGKLYVNEINTIPGFTSISMFPKMWEYSGIPYAGLLDRLIALALERHAAKKATRYTRD
jgi:D-alanine-D-alanine ligase